jgi:hypothetical protein
MGTTYHNKPIVTDGLVFYVDAANKESYPGSGTTATDIISNTSTTLQSSGMFENTNAGVFSFDGGTNYIDSGITLDGFSNFTLNTWIYQSSEVSSNPITIFARDSAGNASFMIDVLDSGRAGGVNNKLGVWIRNGTSPGTWLYGDTALSTNIWNNISVTLQTNGTNFDVTMYLNSQVNKSTTAYGTGTSITSANVNYGIGITIYQVGSDYRPFNGNIGPVQIYNRALSASEALQNYNALKNRFRT